MTRLGQHTAECTNALKHIFTKHKHKRRNVTCPVRSTVGCTPRYKKLCWIRCALHERVLQPPMCASMSEDCRFVHFAEFLFRASHHFSPPLSHPPVRDSSGVCPGAVLDVLVRFDGNFNVVVKRAFVGYYQFKDVDQSSQYSFCIHLQYK